MSEKRNPKAKISEYKKRVNYLKTIGYTFQVTLFITRNLEVFHKKK